MEKQYTKSEFFKQNNIVSDITSIKGITLANQMQLFKVNKDGLFFRFKKDQMIVPERRLLKEFLNDYVELFLSGYELYLNGVIKSVSLVDKNLFEIHVGFTKNTPDFYKECIADLIS